MAKAITIWTAAYDPFIMGGNVHAPIATTWEVTGEPIDLGRGISVYVVVSPCGSIHIAEATTGAFVGTDLAEVRKDVAEAPSDEIMQKQIEATRSQLKKARHLTPEDFWARLAKAK